METMHLKEIVEAKGKQNAETKPVPPQTATVPG